jgi:hypothetical protein
MKTKTLVCVLVFLVFLITGVFSFADDREQYVFYVPKRNEEIYGTWINPKYRGEDPSNEQKYVNYEWGYGEGFLKVTDKNPIDRWTYIIADKWTDTNGNIWYKVFTQQAGPLYGSTWFTLNKLSANGTVMEFIWDYKYFPMEADLNPNAINYRIYNRK